MGVTEERSILVTASLHVWSILDLLLTP